MSEQSKTPKFDATLEAILNSLAPYKRECRACKSEFEIFAEDIDFYKKLRVPSPLLCPQCRMRAKLRWRIIIVPVFYKKKCNAPNHDEEVISFYRPDNPVKVYDNKYYISDAWDGLDFGIDFNTGESFFIQFQKLAEVMPHQSLQGDFTSVGCEYTISGAASKNCYYSTAPYHSEDIYYGWLNAFSRNCIDCSELDHCEFCYGSIFLRNCHNCYYCLESTDCLDSYFLYDCHNCSNCFMSSNLRNKKYVFNNKQLSKEEYEKRLNETDLANMKTVRKHWQQFEDELLSNAIHKCVNNVKVENTVGDYLEQCKNCYYVFRSTAGASENLRYVWSFDNLTDCLDIYGAAKSSLSYNSTAVVSSSQVKCSILSRHCREIEYSIECTQCDYCFGCFGLKNKKYCIFNQQYTEEEYWSKVDELKTAMLERGEYGEFFPNQMSPFPYEDTIANIYYPKTVISEQAVASKNSKSYKSIQEVGNDLLNQEQICERTCRPFKITPFELAFYKTKNIPIPVLHPFERARDRVKYQRPYKLWDIKCSNCNQPTKTVHDPAKNYTIYCESCYQQEVV